MSDHPALSVTDPTSGSVTGIAIVLHGGRSKSHATVRANQLAVLRMRPFATALQRAGGSHGLAVARMRYLVRGWNGAEQSPVHDVAWVLDQLTLRYPDVPVALVGHSMGGRAAMYSAGHPAVRTVVGLAPWLEPGDPWAQLADRRLLVVHGDGDRMTSPDESSVFTRAAATVAESATYVTVRGEKHAMLKRAGLWHELSAGFVLATMYDVPPTETVGTESAKILSKVFTGAPSVVA